MVQPSFVFFLFFLFVPLLEGVDFDAVGAVAWCVAFVGGGRVAAMWEPRPTVRLERHKVIKLLVAILKLAVGHTFPV